MAYIGIGYNGERESFLHERVDENLAWLKGDRLPRLFGNCFVVLYDSNTAREFVKRCREAAEPNTLSVYPMDRPYEY